MAFEYVGHVAYQNAAIKYTASDGTVYEIGGTYSGAYPGATRDSQAVETDSVTITIPGAAAPQQWSFQAPAAKTPWFDDMFAGQSDGDPRSFEVEIQERILYEASIPPPTLAIAVDGIGTIAPGASMGPVPAAEQYPLNSRFTLMGNTDDLTVIGFDTTGKPQFASRSAAVSATAIEKISMAGLRYGFFLASVDEIGQVDDTGVVMYRVAFTPSSVVAAPTAVIA